MAFDIDLDSKQALMKTTTDVLITGAGPVGLLLATELSRDGVDVVLVDRLAERRFFCKALGVTPRTLEIFDDLGFGQDAIDKGASVFCAQIGMTWLVRPDLHIGWCSGVPSAAGLRSFLKMIALMPSTQV
jgi:threonine dehydrogenase-like Zn-dependent dehydrogenase